MLCLSAGFISEHSDNISEATLNAINAAPVETYFLASLMMNIVNWLLGIIGLEHNPTIVTWTYTVVVFIVSFAIGYVAKWIILGGVRRLSRHWDNDLYRFLRQEMFFTKLCRIIPAIVFLIFIQFTLMSMHNRLADILTRITLLYVIYVTVMALSAFIGAVWANIDAKRNKKHLPLRGLVQLIRGIIWIIAIIIAVALLVNKSPASLLAGLGALSLIHI